MQWRNEQILLLDPDIFAEHHLPQDIHAGEEQLKQIEIHLRLITEGRKPINCWLHGR